MGKQTAHAVVYDLAMAAREQGIPFSALLKQDEKVRCCLNEQQIDSLLDPANYLGEAVEKSGTGTGPCKSKRLDRRCVNLKFEKQSLQTATKWKGKAK